jgi:excisionase family DNA binding protein
VELAVNEAAEKLGISPRRVRALAAAGRVQARRVGNAWLVRVDEQAPPRPSGRRFSARSAWAVLGLGEDGLSRSERRRALERRARLLDLPRSALANRADVHRLYAHPGVLPRVAADPRFLPSGVSASERYGADILAAGRQEGYVRHQSFGALRREFGLIDPPRDVAANLVLRVPRPDWPFVLDADVAPLLVVVADLQDAGDARSVRAAEALLR